LSQRIKQEQRELASRRAVSPFARENTAMPARSANGVLFSEPTYSEPIESDVERGDDSVPPAVATEDREDAVVLRGPQAWKTWIHGTIDAMLDNEREALIPFFERMVENRLRDLGDEVLDLIAPRLKQMELQLAETRGVINVLQSQGLVDRLAVIRAELEDTIETQAQKIEALQLRLAEMNGVITCLRSRNLPGGAFAVRGTFDPNATYHELDVVMHGGSSWVATRDRPANAPAVVVGNCWLPAARAECADQEANRPLRALPG
jgi:hypothetical protein